MARSFATLVSVLWFWSLSAQAEVPKKLDPPKVEEMNALHLWARVIDTVEWQALWNAVARCSRRVDQAHTVNINTSSLRKAAKDVAQRYVRQTRPVLQDPALGQQLEGLNACFQSLLELCERNSAKSSYKK